MWRRTTKQLYVLPHASDSTSLERHMFNTHNYTVPSAPSCPCTQRLQKDDICSTHAAKQSYKWYCCNWSDPLRLCYIALWQASPYSLDIIWFPDIFLSLMQKRKKKGKKKDFTKTQIRRRLKETTRWKECWVECCGIWFAFLLCVAMKWNRTLSLELRYRLRYKREENRISTLNNNTFSNTSAR